jgi:ribonuclease P protein subunit POP4
MMQTPLTKSNLVAHELTGLCVRITRTSDPTLRELNGRVRFETKNTLSILSSSKLSVVPKASSEFAFVLPGGSEVIVEGKALQIRPEDRVKRGVGNW